VGDDRCDPLCLDLPRGETIRKSLNANAAAAEQRELPMAPIGCTLDDSGLAAVTTLGSRRCSPRG
jgi:hypothetical protein